MANFNQPTLSFYHTFSKTQVNKNAPYNSLGNSINKSGHTVQSSEVWTDDIPFFAEKGTTGEVHSTFSAHARTNDLVKVGSVIYQRNATPYTSGATFETLWSPKTKSITGWTIENGAYKYTEVDGGLVNGSYLINSAGKPVIKYYEKAQLSILTAANNANVTSNKLASRLKVGGTWGTDSKESVPFMNGGQWVEQFVTVTDKYLNGEAATIYAPQVYATSTTAAPYVAGSVYFDFCATGVILWDSKTADGKEVITCFEYVGDKLNKTVEDLAAAVFGQGVPGADASLTQKVAQNTAAINTLNSTTIPAIQQSVTNAITTAQGYTDTKIADELKDSGSIAQKITSAIDALGDVAVKRDITITEIKVKSGSTTTTLTPDSNKSVTVEIPEVQAATTSVAGVVTISDNDAIATTETSTAAATVAAVAATRSAIAGELGALAETVGSNKTEVDGKITAIEGKLASTGEIGQAIADVKATADSAVQSVTRASGSSTLLTVTDGTNATISLSNEVATKTDAANAASTAITTSLNGTATGTIGAAVADAKKAGTDAMAEAQKKVASITTGTVPEGVSITTGTTPQLSIVTAQSESEVDSGKLVTKALAEGISSNYANSAANTIKGQSLAQTGTLSGMFTVQTAGTVGTGITGITITDAGLGQAISDAKKAGTDAQTSVNTLSGTSLTYSTTADNVTLTLGGTVSSPKIQFAGVASTTALAALETKVDNFHKAGVSYKVLSELPAASVDYNGVIVLVPTEYGVTPEGDEKEAIAGGYVEHLCVNKGTDDAPQWVWEQIGTTEADLHGYVNKIHSSQAGTLANQGSVYAGISSTGYLSIGVASATDSVMGVSKMFTGELHAANGAGATDTAVSVLSAQAMYQKLASLANNKVASVTAGNGDALTGLSVSVGGSATAPTISVTNGVINNGSIPVTAKVVANGLIDGTDVVETEKINFGATNTQAQMDFIPYDSQLTTWIGDMPNLQSGYHMFANCSQLETFIGDLSSVTNGNSMFHQCTSLTKFISDLSSLTNEANSMFYGCNLDAESLECIAETLPTVTSSIIDIGAATNATDEVIATIQGKGWTVRSNGTDL